VNVLVTGGAGYIGSVTVDRLIARGDTVTVLDNLSHGFRDAVNSSAELIVGDIGDTDAVREVATSRAIDAVIHFAGLISVAESVANPALYMKNNVEHSIRMLEGIRLSGVGQLVFSSSAAVYGVPHEVPIAEDHPKAPSSPYGWTKLAFEQILGSYAHAYDFASVSLRYFNACGSTDRVERHIPETHLIPLILEVAAKKRDHIKVFGDDYDTPDGTCVRDYVHVSDLAEAHLAALDYLAEGGATTAINLGTGSGYSVHEVITAAREATGHDIPSLIDSRRAGDPNTLVASAERAHEVLNWKAETVDLADMITSAWDPTNG